MAKINISVSSDSSKPRITISKGPVGPQGEQGIQGEVGPQGPPGTVLELSAIPDVILAANPPVGVGTYDTAGDLINNLFIWDVNYNNGEGRWTYLGDATLAPSAGGSPAPGQAFVYRAIGENLTAVSSLSSNIMGVGVSGSMPNDVNLYVDGDSRFNGSVDIASGGATVYTLPTADGTANQVMKTDGSGTVAFGSIASSDLSDSSNVVLADSVQVISGAKLFTATPTFSSGLTVSSGGASVSGNSQFGSASFSGDISTTQLSFLSGANTIATASGASPEDLHISSDGNVKVILDNDDDQTGQKFIVDDSANVERFSVSEDGAVRVNNAYTFPTSDSNANYFLKTDGSGQLFFATVDGTSGNTAASPPPPPTYSLDDLTDVDTTTAAPTTGQALVWSGSQWAPGAGSPWTTSGSDIYYTTGNVGIGTATPASHLDVDGGSNGHVIFRNSGTAAGNGIRLIRSSSSDWSGVNWYEGGNLTWAFGENSSGFGLFEDGLAAKTRLLVSSGGNVGVGTTTPAHKLDVNGRVNASNFNGIPVGSLTVGNMFVGNSNANSSVYATSIGLDAGRQANGNYGTYVGYYAGNKSNGVSNTAVGNSAGDGWLGASNTKSNNSYVGASSGYGYGHYNSGVGVSSTRNGAGNVVFEHNAGLGYAANSLAGASSHNVAVGSYANNGPGRSYNVSVGSYTNKETSGNNNVAVGHEAAQGTSGTSTFSNTVAVGYQALTALTTGTGNTAIGYQADNLATDGTNNTTVGYQATTNGTSVNNATAVGYDAIASNTSVAIGSSSRAATTTGRSVAIGNLAAANTYDTVAIGYDSGPRAGGNPSASVFIGNNAGNSAGGNGLGQRVVIGASACSTNGGGRYSVYIGQAAGRFGNQNNNSSNVMIGANAAYQHNSTTSSVGIGHNAMNGADTTGSVAVGWGANAGDADYNIMIGYQAGNNSMTGGNNTMIGYQSGLALTTSANTVALGHQALTALTTGAGNTAVGYQAGDAITTGNNNTLFGYSAGGSVTGSSLTAIGYEAGKDVTTSTNSTLIGYRAGASHVGHTNHTVVGANAGNTAGSGNDGTVIGSGAYITGSNQTAVGAGAATSNGGTSLGAGARAGSYAVAIGQSAGSYSRHNEWSTHVGRDSGNDGKYSVALGAQSLAAANTASYYNVALGYSAGSGITSGGSNILIGYQAGSTLTTESNKLYIENSNSTTPLIYGEFDNDLVRINGDFEVTGNINNSIDDLNDVDTTTVAPTDGQALVWNNANSEWEPGDVDIPGFTSTAVDTNNAHEWFIDPSQIIGVGSYNTSGTEIAFGEGHPRDLFFKPDGTRLFIVGSGIDDIQSVDLPTAWDLSSIPSTATVTSVNLAGSAAVGGRGFEGALYGMHVANDPNDTATYGKKFFVVGDSVDEVQEYTCTTAWDLSTMSTDATAVFDLRTDHGNSVYGIQFKPDGSVMYIISAGNPNKLSHYDLSTNWDLSTATYNSSKSTTVSLISTSYSNTEGYLVNFTFNEDGTKAWYTGRTRHNLHQVTLSTAWDFSTYSDDQTPLNISGGYVEQAFGTTYPSWNQENFQWPSGLFNTGDYFYILFNTNDQIIRLDKKYNQTQIRDEISNKVIFENGLRSYGEVEVIGTIESSGFRTGGNAYFSGAMNWSGFNSGPGVTKNNTFYLGTSMGNLAFVNSSQPSGYANATSKDVNNTTAGTWVFPSDLTGANNLVLPANSGTVLLDTTPNLYFNAFDNEAAAKITGATETVEYYYTARADGQGEKEAFKHDIPAPGQTISRKVYYANKALADPDTAADWTLDTSHTSYSDATTAAKALLNSASTGTPPLTTKVATTGLSTVDWFTLTSGDMTIGYSLRLLNPYYTGAAIRVINDSNVEADIGFVQEELDTTALLSHCGSGDGYLVKWYDQSQTGGTGSGNDATYGNPYFTPVNRPKIVSAGSVLTENGKPCIFVEDSSMQLASQVDFPRTDGTLVAYVSSKNASADNNSGMILGDHQGFGSQSNRIWEHGTYIQSLIYNGTTNHTFASPEDGAIAGSGQHVVMLYRDPSAYWYMDKNSVNSGQSQNRNYTFSIETLFNGHNNIAYSYYGNVQEIIAFDSGKSTERADIKSNINAYYSIY